MGFEAGDELFFFFDLLFGLENEVGGGALDIIGILHTEIEGVQLAADREDFLGEGIFVLLDNLFGDVKVEFVISEGESEAPWRALEGSGGGNLGEGLDQEKVIRYEAIVIV